jgi:4-hydroxy-2-oxoheptanedioate aldolase
MELPLPVNAFKHAIAAGRAQIGLWSSIPSTTAVEILAGAGFDWILLDTEHTPNDLESVFTQLQAAAAYPVSTLVRVPWSDQVVIKRYLDAGAQTLLIPFISNADEARAAVSYTRYPPDGVRGVGGTTRATRYGRIRNYAKRAHEELCVLVQVETREGLERIEEICAVDGVDGVFIGPADLHASFGYTGETANPEIVPLIDDGIRRIRAAGKAPGVLTAVESMARHWLGCGALFVAVGADVGVLARGAEALAHRFKS